MYRPRAVSERRSKVHAHMFLYGPYTGGNITLLTQTCDCTRGASGARAQIAETTFGVEEREIWDDGLSAFRLASALPRYSSVVKPSGRVVVCGHRGSREVPDFLHKRSRVPAKISTDDLSHASS